MSFWWCWNETWIFPRNLTNMRDRREKFSVDDDVVFLNSNLSSADKSCVVQYI